jgi:23S rRNA (cytosine1962-C5)-methyltransferase
MGEEDFREVLLRAQAQVGRTVQWVVRGGQGLDHPVRAEFPEGRYLKCWIGVVEG